MQQNRKHYLVWEAENPIIKSGEIVIAFGFEDGFDRSKVGNGVSTFLNLPYQASKSIPIIPNISALKTYKGPEEEVYVQSVNEYYTKYSNVGKLRNSGTVVVASSVLSNANWVKRLEGKVEASRFDIIPDHRLLGTIATTTATVAVPEIVAEGNSDYLLLTLTTSGVVVKNSILSFRESSQSQIFDVFIEDWYIANDNEVYVRFKNELKRTFPATNLNITITSARPVFNVTDAGVITCPEGVVTANDIGKTLQIQDSYLEAALNTDANFVEYRIPGRLRYNISKITGVTVNAGVATITVSGEIPNVNNSNLQAEVYTNNHDALQTMFYYASFKKSLQVIFPRGTVGFDPYTSVIYPPINATISRSLKVDFNGENIELEGIAGESFWKLCTSDRGFVTKTNRPILGGGSYYANPYVFVLEGSNGVMITDKINFDGPTRTAKGSSGFSGLFTTASGTITGYLSIRNSRNRDTGIFSNIYSVGANNTLYNIQNLQTNIDYFEINMHNFTYKASLDGSSVQTAGGVGVKWSFSGSSNILDVDSGKRWYSIGRTKSTSYITTNVANIGQEVPKIVVISGSNIADIVGNWMSIYDLFESQYIWEEGGNNYQSPMNVYSQDGTTVIGTIRLDRVIIDSGKYKLQLKANATFSSDISGNPFGVRSRTSHYIYGQGAISFDFENYRQLGNGLTFRSEGSTNRPLWAQIRKFKNCQILQSGLRVDQSGGANAPEIWQFEDCLLSMNQSPVSAIYIRTSHVGAANGGTFYDCTFKGGQGGGSVSGRKSFFYNCSGNLVIGVNSRDSEFYNSNKIIIFGNDATTKFIGGSVTYVDRADSIFRNVAFAPDGTVGVYGSFTVSSGFEGPNAIGCSIGDFPFVRAGESIVTNVNRLPVLAANQRTISTGVEHSISGFVYYTYRGAVTNVQQRGAFFIPLGAVDFSVPAFSFPFGNPAGFFYTGNVYDSDVRHGIRFTARNIQTTGVRVRFHDLNVGCPVARGHNTHTIPVGTTLTMRYNKFFQSVCYDKLPTVSLTTKPTIVGARNEFILDSTINNGAGWIYLAEPRTISQTFSLSGLISGNTLDLTTIVGATGQIADGWLDPTLERPYPFSLTLPLTGGGTVTFEAVLGFPASWGAGWIYDNVDEVNTRRIRISNTTRRTLDLTNDGVDVNATGNATIQATIYPQTGWFRHSPDGLIEKLTTALRTAITADCREGYEVFDTSLNQKFTLINGTWI